MPQSPLTVGHAPISHRPRSRRAALLVLGVLLSAILGGGMVRIAARGAVAVYAVATLHHDLDHDRATWIGHTVWVRGVVLYAGQGPQHADHWTPSQMYLVDPAAPSSLLFVLGPPDALNSALRQVPLLGPLWPPPQVPRLDVLTEYRVRLDVVPCWGARGCAACVLLDASFPQSPVSDGYRAKDANKWM